MSDALARVPFSRLPGDGPTDLNFQAVQRMLHGMFVPKVVTHALSPYPVLATDWHLLVDATAGAVTITFPLAARVDGISVKVTKTDASANAVTLSGTFSGAVNPTLAAQYKSKTIEAGNGVYYVTAAV